MATLARMAVERQPGPKILVRTLMRTTSPRHLNYGGLLQAWALQRTLRDQGFECATDESRPDVPARTTRLRAALMTVSRVAPPKFVPMRAVRADVEEALNENLLQFGREELDRVRLFGEDGRLNEDVLSGFDGLVSGSDQIWRSDYGDVLSYLFDFVPDSFSGPRVAYAASFGSDEPPFDSPAYSNGARDAARKLTAVSVREDSAVELTRRLWEVDAERVLDPTLLLRPGDYLDGLANEAREARGAIVTYVLDPSPEKLDLKTRLAAELSSPVYDLLPPVPTDFAEFVASRETYVRPPVGTWVGAISEAKCVLTDSFHGCAFAVLFSRPFLVVPNHQRGLARFESLLRLVGLEDRFVSDGDIGTQMQAPIDWERVHAALDIDRDRSLRFLRSALNVSI